MKRRSYVKALSLRRVFSSRPNRSSIQFSYACACNSWMIQNPHHPSRVGGWMMQKDFIINSSIRTTKLDIFYSRCAPFLRKSSASSFDSSLLNNEWLSQMYGPSDTSPKHKSIHETDLIMQIWIILKIDRFSIVVDDKSHCLHFY